MTINSLDHLLSRATSGFTFTSHFNYHARDEVATSGTAMDFSRMISSGGTPLNFATGTSLAWTPCNESTGNGTEVFGLQHGGNVSPATKHITDITLLNSTLPTFSILVDVQGYWPNISFSTTSTQNLTGTPGSNLRYANGVGCMLYMVSYQLSTVTANLSISYTNQAGTTGRALGRTVLRTTTTNDRLVGVTNGTGNNYTTFLPLAAGDTGVANVASVSFDAATGAGQFGSLVLARPLAYIQNFGATSATFVQKSFVDHLPSLPEVKDGACLTFINRSMFGNQSVLRGSINFVW